MYLDTSRRLYKRDGIQAEFEVPVPILICTYTNMALDHVVEGLVERGLKPLRVGIDGKVQPALREYSLEAYLDRHPRRSELERLVRDETTLQEKLRTLERNIDEARTKDRSNRQANLRTMLANVDRQFWAVRAKLYRLRQVMITDVLEQADVVGSRIRSPFPSLLTDRVLDLHDVHWRCIIRTEEHRLPGRLP